MSIFDTNKVDIVATRPESKVVRLVVTDHLPWADVETHSRLLQAKLNTYLEFLESGQINNLASPPIPDEPEFVFSIVARYPPPREGQEFLDRIKSYLMSLGIGFVFDLRTDLDDETDEERAQ